MLAGLNGLRSSSYRKGWEPLEYKEKYAELKNDESHVGSSRKKIRSLNRCLLINQ